MPSPSSVKQLVRLVAQCYHYYMSQPVKISDELLLDARLTGEVAERSIAGQIEFWAHLGRAIEPLLAGSRALARRGVSWSRTGKQFFCMGNTIAGTDDLYVTGFQFQPRFIFGVVMFNLTFQHKRKDFKTLVRM